MNVFLIEESPEQQAIRNLEIGAGCGDFGKRFFAPCYLTENPATFSGCPEGHHIDVFCSALELPWEEGRFENVIICNPWLYGFSDIREGYKLLKELVRVVTSGGKIIIIGSRRNTYCDPDRIRAVVEIFAADYPQVHIQVQEEAVNLSRDFQGYDKFFSSSGQPTIPNVKVSLYVHK